jgi:hypothetical protein
MRIRTADDLIGMWTLALHREVTEPVPCRSRALWMCSKIEDSVAASKLIEEFKAKLLADLDVD